MDVGVEDLGTVDQLHLGSRQHGAQAGECPLLERHLVGEPLLFPQRFADQSGSGGLRRPFATGQPYRGALSLTPPR